MFRDLYMCVHRKALLLSFLSFWCGIKRGSRTSMNFIIRVWHTFSKSQSTLHWRKYSMMIQLSAVKDVRSKNKNQHLWERHIIWNGKCSAQSHSRDCVQWQTVLMPHSPFLSYQSAVRFRYHNRSFRKSMSVWTASLEIVLHKSMQTGSLFSRILLLIPIIITVSLR